MPVKGIFRPELLLPFPGRKLPFEIGILGELLFNRRTQIVLSAPACVKFLTLDFETHTLVGLTIETGKSQVAMQ